MDNESRQNLKNRKIDEHFLMSARGIYIQYMAFIFFDFLTELWFQILVSISLKVIFFRVCIYIIILYSPLLENHAWFAKLRGKGVARKAVCKVEMCILQK